MIYNNYKMHRTVRSVQKEGGTMDTKRLKKMLAGFSIAGLLSGAGLTLGAPRAIGGSG